METTLPHTITYPSLNAGNSKKASLLATLIQ